MEACNAVSVDGFVCGRPPGHAGQHEAHVGSAPSRWWGDARDGRGKDQDDESYRGIRVEEMWVFVTTGPDDQEGVAAVHHEDMGMLPLIATDATRLTHLKKIAADLEAALKEEGVVIRLLHFGGPPEVIEDWKPS